jgi:hypothetical protein
LSARRLLPITLHGAPHTRCRRSPLTRSALVDLLEQHSFAVVGEAADGVEAVGVPDPSPTSSSST